MKTGTIVKVSDPLVIAEGMRDANMFDVVRVSDKHLIGEIIEMHGDKASIQVYEGNLRAFIPRRGCIRWDAYERRAWPRADFYHL